MTFFCNYIIAFNSINYFLYYFKDFSNSNHLEKKKTKTVKKFLVIKCNNQQLYWNNKINIVNLSENNNCKQFNSINTANRIFL